MAASGESFQCGVGLQDFLCGRIQQHNGFIGLFDHRLIQLLVLPDQAR
jgi:hypothetical protein